MPYSPRSSLALPGGGLSVRVPGDARSSTQAPVRVDDRVGTSVAAEPIGIAVRSVIERDGHSISPVDGTRIARGHDLSNVRVHADNRAAEVTHRLGVRAFTIGSDIVFGRGEYSPGTTAGRSLLSHELTHVVQQQNAAGLTTSGSDSRDLEMRAEAAETAGGVASHPGHGAPPVLQAKHLFTGTFQLKYLLKTRTFHVSEGGVVVSASGVVEKLGTPEVTSAPYHVTLTSVGRVWDSEWGTADFPQGEPVTQQWAGVPDGDYYLAIWIPNSNPYAELVGDVIVEERAGLVGPSSTMAPPGPVEILQGALDLAGMIPALGVIPDAINTGIYCARGEWADAGLSAIAIIPIFGDAAKAGVMGGKAAIRIEGEAVRRLGKDAIAQGLKEARATGKVATETASDLARAEKGVAEEIDEMVERGIRPEVGSTTRPTPRPRPVPPATKGTGAAARAQFDKVRDGFAAKLGVGRGGQVHHAVELQVLDRYPGVFKASELNDLANMRGIATERAGRRQLHNSKIREIWDRHYTSLDAQISKRGLKPGTAAYDDLVRSYLQSGRDEIDYVLGQFFTEYRRTLM